MGLQVPGKELSQRGALHHQPGIDHFGCLVDDLQPWDGLACLLEQQSSRRCLKTGFLDNHPTLLPLHDLEELASVAHDVLLDLGDMDIDIGEVLLHPGGEALAPVGWGHCFFGRGLLPGLWMLPQTPPELAKVARDVHFDVLDLVQGGGRYNMQDWWNGAAPWAGGCDFRHFWRNGALIPPPEGYRVAGCLIPSPSGSIERGYRQWGGPCGPG